MKIEIDGQTYDVPQGYVAKLVVDAQHLAEDFYENKVGDVERNGLMILTRGLLLKEEMSVRAKFGKEAALKVRPPKKSDPNLWLLKMFLPVLEKVLNNVTITCQIESSTVTAFNVSIAGEGSSGGQVDTAGDKWVWKDNSTQVS